MRIERVGVGEGLLVDVVFSVAPAGRWRSLPAATRADRTPSGAEEVAARIAQELSAGVIGVVPSLFELCVVFRPE